jgi:hypothetical protein
MNQPSSYYDIPDFKGFVPEKVKQLIELLKNEEVQTFLKIFIDSSIATSDLAILKRLTALEDAQTTTKIDDNKAPEQIPTLTTRTDRRASKIVERIKGKRFLDSSEIIRYLKSGIDEPLRIKEGQNYRQIKKEVLNKVVELFPSLRLDKKKNGRREVRLIAPT